MDKKSFGLWLAEQFNALRTREIFLDIPKDEFIAQVIGKKGDVVGGKSRENQLKGESGIVKTCTRCSLARGRLHAVYGDGNPYADIVFVGEAPGAEEDRQGLPFVGRAGVLLNRLLEQVGLSRSEVYICNVIKCRPPENRDPLPEEVAACKSYLDKQLTIIKPHVICCLGLYAAQAILNTKEAMTRLRNAQHKLGDILVVPTYHTAAALRFPAYKQQIYDDLVRVRDLVYG